jgi:FMN phosphatase YigB (HAD superfamily)
VDVVFLLDFDNTLSDNDLARDRLTADTLRILGREWTAAFWEIYERVREEAGYVDFVASLERFHREHPEAPVEPLDRAILDFPYADVRYPETLEVIEGIEREARPVVLSDGDPVFQPLKIARSGVGEKVHGDVLVFEHKEEHLDVVARLFPADHYVAVDDKAAVLARMKGSWGARLSTVHVLQGKYADDAYEGPAPDGVIEELGDLLALVGTPHALRMFIEDATSRAKA